MQQAASMTSPLSELSSARLNARSPPLVREKQFASLLLTPQKPADIPLPDEDIIDWDDDAPSSPFVTELGPESRSPSRQVSNAAQQRSQETHFRPAAVEDATTTMTMKGNTLQFDVYEDEIDYAVESVELARQQDAPVTSTENTSRTAALAMELDSVLAGPASDAEAMPPPLSSPIKSSKRLSVRTPPSAVKSDDKNSATARTKTSSFAHQFEQYRNDQADLAADQANIDDTCFSAFSEIPDMTQFARLGEATPRAAANGTPRTIRKRVSLSRSPSPTERRQRTPGTASGNTTSFLIDFTQQIESYSTSNPHVRRSSPVKSQTEPNLLSYINDQRSPTKSRQSFATPSKPSILNLLDFELPPAPTPRSVPTITVRELETVKSSYLSQVSSLKATLAGREAEVDSLKKAVNDAERRVGEALENVREERSKREHVEREKAEWEKRGTEVEEVLKSVKEEVMNGESEKEELCRCLESAERRAEEAEERAREVDSRARRAADNASVKNQSLDGTTFTAPDETEIQRLVQAQLDQKIENVSRELHSIYKKKHETKVATLKKSYEARSEKKCAELQLKIEDLLKRNENLHAAKQDRLAEDNEANSRHVQAQRVELEEQRVRLAGLEAELGCARAERAELLAVLAEER
ncbi:hypothetical protein LTR66_009122, partial [Elasticomyces elasticus]